MFGGGAGAGQRCGDHKMLVPHLSALLWCVSVVGGRINNSMVNFAGCEVGGCEEVRCGDGTLAPALPGRCCGDRSLCPAQHCAAIGCLVELCPDGQMPPVPPGRCCPSALLCPRLDCPSSCPPALCSHGGQAPTPAGKCCPDPSLCDRERECASKEHLCKPQFCPNGELAPIPEGSCCPSRAHCPLQHCQNIACPPKTCPLTGDLAPIPRDSCCPSLQECGNTNCSQVRCIVDRCPDGSIAPVPPGQCCPSRRACPVADYRVEETTPTSTYSLGTDCSAVTCYLARCPGSNAVAPVPWGNCCPNPGLCPVSPVQERVSTPQQSIESF